MKFFQTQKKSDFLWGVATAALQIEGNLTADGAGKSSWETFATDPGRIRNGETPNQGCDHFNRYVEDVALIKELGAQAYRFSISWSRIIPNGIGKVNTKGFDFYDHLIDELLKNDITPFITIFHWEIPDYLEKEWGGWRNPDTAKALGDFAALVAERYSDRVTNFITVNEIPNFSYISYGENPENPPAIKLEESEVNKVIFHGVMGHAYAANAIREVAHQAVKVGFAENPHGFVPATDSAQDIEAAKTAMRYENARITTLILEGNYPPGYTGYGNEESFALIKKARPDFMGQNIYSGCHVIANTQCPHGYRIITKPFSYPCLGMPWLQIEPDSLYWSIRFATELWHLNAIYITENGCAADNDVRDENNRVLDTDRVMFIRQYLRAAERAIKEGLPLCGYFHWSLMDNFEWTWGYQKCFGLVEVNRNTMERRPKLSAEYFSKLAKANKFPI
jgi:beta-glucosidase